MTWRVDAVEIDPDNGQIAIEFGRGGCTSEQMRLPRLRRPSEADESVCVKSVSDDRDLRLPRGVERFGEASDG
jgi:hypothetical protein